MIDSGKKVLEACGISKSFPGVKALDAVDLTLRSGKLTALLGENGAGKSTLMNIVAGVLQPDSGDLRIQGQSVRFYSPRQAMEHGIAMIYQELNLVPEMSIAENIFLGREPMRRYGLIDYVKMNAMAAEWLERMDLVQSPTTLVRNLRVGQQQIVEIAKALARNVQILILDEPTSAITEREIEGLFKRILELKQQGVALAYITHKLDELHRIGDDVAIMRDGRMIEAFSLGTKTKEEMVASMVGRDVEARTPNRAKQLGDPVLRVERLSLPHPTRSLDRCVDEVSFEVRQGEVLGIFGLMGAGRTELLECIFGLHARSCTGSVFIDGAHVTLRSPADAIAHGIAMAPEDRKRDGLFLAMSVAENASMACLSQYERLGIIDRRSELRQADNDIASFRIKTRSSSQCIRELSGGNQQKVVLAKWLATNPKVMMLDEPTRGIDVQAKAEIYDLIDTLKNKGMAFIVVSSELPEIMAISDRILVLSEGRCAAEMQIHDATEEKIMHAALPSSQRLISS